MLYQRFTNLKNPAFGPQVAADAKVEVGDRLVRLSFSSEIPVLRDTPIGPAFEVLGHDPDEVDLSRLNSGSAPVLKDHRRNVDSMVGTVVSAQVEGRRGRAIVRLSDTAEGNSMLARIKAGEVQSVSVGYAVHELKPAIHPPFAPEAPCFKLPQNMTLTLCPCRPGAAFRGSKRRSTSGSALLSLT